MDRIRCTCRQCDSKLGDFFNQWIQIGKTYFTPIIDPSGVVNLRAAGAVRWGDENTLVDECQLQDIACTACGTVVGLKCLSTPVNHVLTKDQMLLRSTLVGAVSCRGSNTAEFVVKRTLHLRKQPNKTTPGSDGRIPRPESSKPSSQYPSARASPPHAQGPASFGPGVGELSQIQASLDLNRQDIDRIDTTGFQIVTTLSESIQKIERDVDKLQKAVSDLRRDFGGDRDEIARVKTEIEGVRRAAEDKSTVQRMETQVQTIAGGVLALRGDLDTLSTQYQTDLKTIESQLSRTRQESQELKGITRSNASTAKEHGKELGSLRGEVSTLRGLLDGHPASQSSDRSTGFGFPNKELDILTDNIVRLDKRISHVDTLQMQFDLLKGKVERMEEIPKLAPSRPTQAPTPNRRKRSSYPDDGEMAEVEVKLETSKGKKPKLTKSGAVDKRTQKRTLKKG